MAYGGCKIYQSWLRPFGQTHQRGSVPLVILVAGIGFVAVTSGLVRMGDRLRGDSESRKRESAEQGNRSAVAVLKQLLASVDATLPAVFPDPYIRNPSDSTTKLAQRSNLTSSGWSLSQSSSSSELTVFTIDPRTSDFSLAFSGQAAINPGRGSTIQISKPGLTTISPQIAFVDSIETTVQVPDPVKPAKMMTTKVRLELSPPPPPTCRIQADPSGISLLVSGAAVSGAVIDSATGTLIGTYDRNNIAAGSATADSIYGRDIEIVKRGWSDLPSNLLNRSAPLAMIGEVAGVSGGATSCSAVLQTQIVQVTPVEKPVFEVLKCDLRMIQGVLEYWGGKQVQRFPELIVKIDEGQSRANVELAQMPEVVQLGTGNLGAGEWSKRERAFPGCLDPPCYRGVFKGRDGWKPGQFSVRIKDTDGNTALCQAFNYGAWDGTWRSGPMAYSETKVGAWAKSVAEENRIPRVANPHLAVSSTIAFTQNNVNKLCQLKGMKPYYSDSVGSEKRTNYTSCGDNSHWTFVGSQMTTIKACDHNWIASLICN